MATKYGPHPILCRPIVNGSESTGRVRYKPLRHRMHEPIDEETFSVKGIATPREHIEMIKRRLRQAAEKEGKVHCDER
jgi:hypothetical protein